MTQPNYRREALAQQAAAEPLDQVIALKRARLSDLRDLWHKARRGRSAGGSGQRVKTPTLLQMEAVECGAAALGIVLRHYGRYALLEDLRLACGVSRNGSTALNIVKAAKSYGLNARGVQRPSLEALSEFALPLILFWNFNHFVVLEGSDARAVYINDPATGPRAVTHAEFDAAFTGVALVLTPGDAFERGGQPFSLIAALRARLKGAEGAAVFVCVVSLFLLIPGFIVPWFLRVFVDRILLNGGDVILPLLAGMGAAVVLRAVLTWLQQTYLLRLETRLALTASRDFFRHVLSLPLAFFSQRYAGEIAQRVQLNDRVARLLSGELATTAINLVLIAFYGLVMLTYDVPLTLVSAGFVAVNLAVLRLVSRTRADANRRLLQQRGKLIGAALNGVRGIETVKATGAEGDFFARWAGLHAAIVNSEQQLGYVTYALSVVPVFLLALLAAIVLIVGGDRVLAGSMTLGMLVAFQSLVFSFTQPVSQLVSLGSRLQEAEGDMNRLDDVLRYTPDALPLDTAERGERLSGALELRDVRFGYSPLDAPFIDGFSLHIAPGERVALVGASGSGKSTIARLVAGLYPHWSGDILFDGKPRPDIPRAVMTRSLAMVDQQIALFSGTIRENLALWDTTIPDDDIIRAAQDACIHDRIMDAGGYDALVEEGGHNFSGGERQRLEIARALAGSPSLLILDEATSALDPLVEAQIDANLRARGCACLMIAHRLSTVRDCDEIIVMAGGRIVERGTHGELLAHSGMYAALLGAESVPS